MRGTWTRRLIGAVAAAVVTGGALWFAWPAPVPVDLAAVAEAPMEVSVDDEGKTRVRQVYTVSAPVAGRVLRTPRQVGDAVAADETVVAVMQATPPGFLDARSRGELQAALAAAEAAVSAAEHEVHRLETALAFARAELERAQALSRRDVIATRTLDRARVELETAEFGLASAKAQLEVRRSERAVIAARLTAPSSGAAAVDPAWVVQVRAPVSGRVLRIHQESEAVVQAGTPLIDIGDPLDIEVVADLLSTDAVQIEPGAPVRVDGWGGPALQGRVARIEPTGFTKISALGIEEQRVRTVIDLYGLPSGRARLGHDFRVIVHVVLWSTDRALTVPVSALFRQGGEWAVFAVRGGRARAVTVQIGRRNNRMAEVVGGISAGEMVVLHPSDRIAEGIAVSERR